MERKIMNLVVLPEEVWNQFRSGHNEILAILKDVKHDSRIFKNSYGYITAMEFMEAVRIRETKFDQLVQTNKIRSLRSLGRFMFRLLKLTDILRISQFSDGT